MKQFVINVMSSSMVMRCFRMYFKIYSMPITSKLASFILGFNASLSINDLPNFDTYSTIITIPMLLLTFWVIRPL